MEIIINGNEIQLGDSMPTITKKSIDINNPSARFLDYTNQFKIPHTNYNSKILEHPSVIGSNGSSMGRLFDVLINDVFKIFSGKGYINNVTKDSIDFQCVDNSKDLFTALDKKLNTVDWDSDDTILTQAGIEALQTAAISSPWVWGKLCLHENALQVNTDQTTGDTRCKFSRPSFYVQGLLSRAVTLQGYTYSKSDIDLAFSSFHSQFFFTSYQKTIAATYNPAGTLAITGLNTNYFAHSDLTVNSGSINIGIKKTKFRVRGTVTSDALMTLVIRATDNVDITKISESKLQIGVGAQIVDFTSSDFQSDNGFTIDMRIDGTGSIDIDALLYTLLDEKEFDLSGNPFLGYKIKVYDNLPDLTFLDLFKLICVIGNQYQKIDSFGKTFQFESFANLNKLNAVDWSKKFMQQSESITSQFAGLAQKNWLKYTNDITVNPELGWSSFQTDNENLAKEIDYIALKFGASNDVVINSNSIAQVSIYNDTGRIIDRTVNMRLFKITGTCLEFEPISWSNLTALYYANFFNSLSRVRAIDGEFNLSKLDVLNWTEKQLVYIDYFKTTFIVLEISNFIPGKKTKVKLLGYGR